MQLPEELNKPRLLALVNNDLAMLNVVVGLFAEDRPKALAAIRGAVDRGDAGELIQAAHAFAGLIGHFSTGSAFRLACELERAGRANDLTGAATGCADLESAIEQLEEALARLVADENLQRSPIAV